MAEKTVLDEKIIALHTRSNERRLQAPNLRFAQKLKDLDNSVSGELSPEYSASAHAFYTFLGVHDAFKESIKSNGFTEQNPAVKEEFFDIYSFYAGAVIGLEYVKRFSDEIDSAIRKYPLEFTQGNKTVQELTELFLDNAAKKHKDTGIADVGRAYFNYIISEASARIKEPKFESLAEQAAKSHIEIKGITINGFNYRQKNDLKQIEFSASLDGIVGNVKLKTDLVRAVENILSYDSSTKSNPVKEFSSFPQSFLIDGRPGTGKTSVLKAVAAYGQKIAAENNLDFNVVIIDSSFKSSYFSDSANNLRKKLESACSDSGTYFVLIDDIDLIFHSRADSKESNQDKDILGVLMNFLEGLDSNNKGNYVVAATTNAPLVLDNALSERFTKITAPGPETEKDYISLFRIKLKQGKYADISQEEWNSIGEKCKEYDFSGRAVDRVCSNIMDGCNNFNKPKNWFKMCTEEKTEYLSKNLKCTSLKEVIGEIESYKTYRQAKEAEEYASKLESIKKQLSLELDARRQLVHYDS